jgi:hypothetical protein
MTICRCGGENVITCIGETGIFTSDTIDGFSALADHTLTVFDEVTFKTTGIKEEVK